MTHTRKLLTCLTAALIAGGLSAQSSGQLASCWDDLCCQLGMTGAHSLQVNHQDMDDSIPVYHLQQYYRGIKVWGGLTNIREESSGFRVATNNTYNDISINLEPVISIPEVLSRVDSEFSLPFYYLDAPTTELTILPIEAMQVRPEAASKPYDQLNAEDVTYVTTGYRLVYHVATDTEVVGNRELMNFFVDATSGEIVEKWNMVLRGAAQGTAKTKYYGTQTLYTNQNGNMYETKDPIYCNNYVTSKSSSTAPYTDADNVWGTGGNYADGTAEAKQTGAADSLLILQRECQMLKAIWGRNGASGTGKAMKIVWGSSAASYTGCAVQQDYTVVGYADQNLYDATKFDIIGHEYGHSLDYYSAKLCMNRTGEGGGMAEGSGDILGLLTEVYGKYSTNDPNNPATTIPEAGMNDPKTWITGEDVIKNTGINGGKGMRFFYKPSLDVAEKCIDAWKTNMSSVEVHAAAGPTIRMFYYLAHGAPSNSSDEGYTSYLPNGSSGIGLHKAGNIWVKTLISGNLSSSSKHIDARNACINMAKSLYGAGGPEEQAVWNAFAGVNVGQPWTVTGVTVAINPATATIRTGATQQFTATVGGSSDTSVTWSCTGGTVSSSGLYTAPTTAGTYTVKATSNADNTKSASATVTVTTQEQVSVSINPTTASLTSGDTQQFTATVTGSSDTSVTWTCTGGTISSTGLYTAPSTLGNYTVKATSNADSTKFASATVTVTSVDSTTFNEVEGNDSLSAANAVTDTATKIVATIGSSTDKDYFRVLVGAGKTLTVKMTGPSGKDYELYLYNSSGTQLAKSTGSTATESLSYQNTGSSAVYFYVYVMGYNGAYSTSTPYNLTLTR